MAKNPNNKSASGLWKPTAHVNRSTLGSPNAGKGHKLIRKATQNVLKGGPKQTTAATSQSRNIVDRYSPGFIRPSSTINVSGGNSLSDLFPSIRDVFPALGFDLNNTFSVPADGIITTFPSNLNMVNFLAGTAVAGA